MSFVKKIWTDRISEYINRRTLTNETTGDTQVVTVTRNEGEVMQTGDAFNAANMNDLEDRVEDAIEVTVEKWSGSDSGNNYVTVDKLAYDQTHKKLGLKVGGADTVIPFNGAAEYYYNDTKQNAEINKLYTVNPNVNINTFVQLSGDLLYAFYRGCLVELNGEIHALGSYASTGYTGHYKRTKSTAWASVSTLPYNFYDGASVVLNGEIHILGGGSSTSHTSHYKFNGTEWVSVSTLPYDFYQGQAVVYNNEIHILGGNGNATKHYKFNGTEWVSVSTLPYDFYDGAAVVYNGEIHILGTYSSSYQKRHYKFINGTWSNASTLPYNFKYGSAVVLNNEIHILGGNGNNKLHSCLFGTKWVVMQELPNVILYNNCAVVLDNEIYIVGGNNNATNGKYAYCQSKTVNYGTETNIFNGSETEAFTPIKMSTIPYDFYMGSAIIANGAVHILGSKVSANAKKHYKWDISSLTWESVSTLPYNFDSGAAVVLNNEIHILGGYNNKTAHYKYNITSSSSSWVSVSTIPYNFSGGAAVVYNGEIHILGGSSSNTEKHYKFNGTEWVSVSTLPYMFHDGAAVVYNGEIHILGYGTRHYAYRGGVWVSMSTLPYSFDSGQAVAIQGKICIIGGYNSKNVYVWDGKNWSGNDNVLTSRISDFSAVKYKGYIFTLGGEVIKGETAQRTVHNLLAPPPVYTVGETIDKME